MKISAVPTGGRLYGVVAAAVLALAATPATGAAQANGAQLYQTRCAACHQADANGIPEQYPPLAGSEWVTGDPARLINIVLHGMQGDVDVNGEVYNGVMPPWAAALNDAELAALATYLRANFGNKASAVTATQVARTRAATASRKTPWTAKELILSTTPQK